MLWVILKLPCPPQSWWARRQHKPHAPQTLPFHGPFWGDQKKYFQSSNVTKAGLSNWSLQFSLPLLFCGILNNGLLSINNMLLQLMRQHTCADTWDTNIYTVITSVKKAYQYASCGISARDSRGWSASDTGPHLQWLCIWMTLLSCSTPLWSECSARGARKRTLNLRVQLRGNVWAGILGN